MYNQHTEQYLDLGDPVIATDPETLREATGTIRGFTKNDHALVFVDVDVEGKLRTFPIGTVVLRGASKLARADMSATCTTRLIYTLVDLHESRYFLDFRAATRDDRAAYVEAVEVEINRRVPPTRRL